MLSLVSLPHHNSTPAIFRGWAHWTGRLPESPREGVAREEVEVHGGPIV